jgi:hypothetical protein
MATIFLDGPRMRKGFAQRGEVTRSGGLHRSVWRAVWLHCIMYNKGKGPLQQDEHGQGVLDCNGLSAPYVDQGSARAPSLAC